MSVAQRRCLQEVHIAEMRGIGLVHKLPIKRN